MCGIFGYIGDKEISSLLIGGLKQLEYRGYDSAGICVSCNGNLKVIKKPGKILELEKTDFESLKGNVGIAHTRWATHGKPNEINAHPHLSCNGEIAIVHNGIIENHHSLRELLRKEGHKIISETDSEIFAHLIEKFYAGNLEEAVVKTLNFIEGAFGLAVIHKNHEEIIVARRGSPLIIGVGEGEMLVASDATGILKHTKKVNYLNDDEIAILKKNSYCIKDLRGNHVDKKIHEIKWEVEKIEKSGFKHFMLKEIFEQPETIYNVLRGRIKDSKIKLTLNLNSVNRIILVACGTSWHSALIGKYLIEETTRIPTEVDYASEFRYRNPVLKENDLVVAISQSGETADTLSAIKEAKAKNINTIGIVNVVGSTISREVNSGIYLHAGPEIGVASTKAFTSQIVALLLLALYLKQKKGLKPDVELLEEMVALPEKIKKVLSMSPEIREVAEKFKNVKNFLYLGRGINFPVALEGALKLKEISYIHAEGYPAAEMKHGPIALVDENMPIVFLAAKDGSYEKVLSNIEEVKARGGKVIAIATENDERLNHLSEKVFIVPKTRSELSPIVNAVVLQILAYHIADLKGIDVDKPRNLAKSVTVE
ncbi:MAG TPA: glutamine--fructose-6-phosphate transaminase (isomerizing) [Candidatus Nanoarchaeia archaeon]|nr:glutamine--fructose-6-phosphate transaminase (isomerizing) [Candidatus Nanoarchaeia archaeon]